MPLVPEEHVITGVSLHARAFALCCGSLLCLWTIQKLRRRALLVSICSLLVAIGGGLIAFAAIPAFFDRFSYAIGIKYPPLLYLVVVILSLLVVILHLAERLSLVDERCRRMAEELALNRESDRHITSVT